MKRTTIHDQAYEYYSWEQLGDDIFALGQEILNSGEEFDRIVALAKGGLTFSRSLVDYLQIDNISTMQIEFYTGIGTTAKTPVITQSLPVTIRGEKILIFDDILDTGGTLKLANEYIQHHGAAKISTAVLVSKPWAEVEVDFSARDSEAWVIFPNETRETIETLTQLWRDAGDDEQRIHSQLLEVGFSQQEVALFADLE